MKLPRSFHNLLSYIGTAAASVALTVFVFLVILDALAPAERAPYASLVMFVLVPAVLLPSLAVIPIGMVLENRRIQRTGKASIDSFPVVNLNEPRQRNAFAIFVAGSVLLLFLSVFGSYEAYEATESVSFCGTTCHTPMEPEHTAYLNSPHARVRCVDCHVGSGAEWYVKSKLSGMYQLYAVATNSYPRPIEVPISNLRPAQETCEQCHWPQKFFEAQLRSQVHYLSDDDNSRWNIDLLIRTGGGGGGPGQVGGIHWHMNIDNKVEYIATDQKRQVIPWVKMTNRKTGAAVEYMSAESPLSDADRAKATIRTVDCMDCHNRPSHVYNSPRVAMNVAMADGRIDPTLPAIKRTGVELLAATYTSADEAVEALRKGVVDFYQKEHPEVLRDRRPAVDKAIAELQTIYRHNFFPAMKVRWDTYPNNIGHFMFPGCFRCHDGQHKSADGRVISRECTSCHSIIAQGKPGAMQLTSDRKGLKFEHPIDIGDAWEETPCYQCHTGGAP
ncbi:MAG TPA: NapC/NirT family cytochrome c [Candidatus Acidoferrales bacterium]|nr:NapC/NirT family cytochrome c [Candidatus Acidoferrales bacterium]